MKDAAYWIEKLGLAKHPEGGYFRETYRSSETLEKGALPSRYGGTRSFATAIYYLLQGHESSSLHRIRSDELWHFYCGASLTIHMIDHEGTYSATRLGNDPEKGEVIQAVVPEGCWFGATVDDPASYALVGCTVAPGFDFSDFELGKRKELIDRFPEHLVLIEKLTLP